MRRRISGALRRRAEAGAEWAFDRRRRIDTTGVWRLPGSNYQPVHPVAFRALLSHVDAERAASTFVDLGSGRGRALFLAAEHGFGAAVGVEVERLHHDVAAANLERYRGRRAAIRLVHGDARHFAFPGGPLVVFIYNAFPRDVTATVVDRLCASLRDDPRPAWLIYEAPFDRDLVDARAEFELVAERIERAGASVKRPRFAVYRAIS